MDAETRLELDTIATRLGELAAAVRILQKTTTQHDKTVNRLINEARSLRYAYNTL